MSIIFNFIDTFSGYVVLNDTSPERVDKMSYENMTNAEPVAWRPDKPHNQLPPIPPPQELESRAVLKADDGRAWRLLIDSRKGSGSNADHAWMQSSQF